MVFFQLHKLAEKKIKEQELHKQRVKWALLAGFARAGVYMTSG